MRVLGLALFVLAANSANAQSAPEEASAEGTATQTDEARAAHVAGASAASEGRYDEAEAHFRRALSISPRESTRYNLGLVLEEQAQFIAAHTIYEALLQLDEEELPADRAEIAAAEGRALAQIATMEVRVTGAERPTVSVDGEDAGVILPGSSLSLRRDPGTYRVEARDGERAHTQNVRLVAGERQVVELLLPDLRVREIPAPVPEAPLSVPNEADSGVHPAVWVTIGVLALGALATGIAFAVRSGDEGYASGPFDTFEN